MHEAGWAGLSWPEEYGGKGATLIEQSIFNEELGRQRVPLPANVLGLVMGGPVVIAHGTEEQKERYLEPILSGEEIWCQGFSEPESGSDLASLKTPRGQVERRLEGDRPEGLDHLRARGEVVHAARPHRPGRPQAQGHHLLHPRHGPAGRRGAAAAPDHRRGRVQRDLHGGGRDPRREHHRRGRRRLAGRDHDADVRARRPRRRRGDGAEAHARGPDRADQGEGPRGRPDAAPEARRAADRDRGDAPGRAALADDDDEDRHPRARGLARQVAVGQVQPGADRARQRDRRRRRASRSGTDWSYRFLRSRANSIEGGTTEVLQNIIAERVLGLPKLR